MSLIRTAALAAAAPAVGVAILASPHTAHAAQTAPAKIVVASSTTQRFRVDITAQRSRSGKAPAATVYVHAYLRRGSRWVSRGDMRLGAPDAFFWKALTGPHAVRDFVMSDAGSDHGSVRLLRTPALGWSPTYQFRISGATLTR